MFNFFSQKEDSQIVGEKLKVAINFFNHFS